MKDWQARFDPQAIIWKVKYGIDIRFAAIQLWSILINPSLVILENVYDLQ